jgi:hypothetical protein
MGKKKRNQKGKLLAKNSREFSRKGLKQSKSNDNNNNNIRGRERREREIYIIIISI